jgi:hypothetical protein
MEKDSIDIKQVSRDIIGVGVDGSGNIICKCRKICSFIITTNAVE